MASATATRSTRTAPVVAPPGARRRRSLPRMIFGALAAVLGALVFAVVGLRSDPGVDVLAVALAVPAGAQVVDADLHVVHIVADPALHVFPASRRSTVVGQVAAIPLAAGSLLTAEQLGTVTDPPPGQSVIAVGVKTGRMPAGLPVGASVLVLVITQGGNGTDAAPLQAPAVVRAVEPTDSAGIIVVTLQLAAEPAVRIASATGDVALVLRNPGR